MKQILLSEYQQSGPMHLIDKQLLALRSTISQLSIEPAIGLPNHYLLKPRSQIGVVHVSGLQVDIRPKIPIDNLFFILSYAIDPTLWLPDQVLLEKDDSVLEVVAPIFCQAVAIATRRGLLHGYRTQEDAQLTVRGQVRFADQLRRHHGLLLPVELRYDEFTEDIPENQILLAALHRLRRLSIRSAKVQRSLKEIASAFHGVDYRAFSSGQLPEIYFHHLNQHYEAAIRLALLILNSCSLEVGAHSVQAHGFLFDMNLIFELFVHRALREALGLSVAEFLRGDNRLRLDQDRQIKLEPDLSLWQQGKCHFVGDIKYKRVKIAGIKHPDIYQLLAYTTAANLPTGLLIYAKGEATNACHVIQYADKTIQVECLDLSKSPPEILADIAKIARIVNLSCNYSLTPSN
jgi:5-methylcytosine-specific restriction enzyme subunit McrC